MTDSMTDQKWTSTIVSQKWIPDPEIRLASFPVVGSRRHDSGVRREKQETSS